MTPQVHISDWLSLAPTLAPASIDLLYADPPFNTGDVQSDRNGSYTDRFSSTAHYIAWLRERLIATLSALKPTASILLHVDWRTSHHVRLLLDELLGEDRFVNHLIWQYGLGGSSPRRFARKHDDILFYCTDPERYWFDPPMVPATSVRMRGQLKKATDVLWIPPEAEVTAPDILDIPSINNMAAERCGYPTQKPLTLLTLLIRACCPPGGTVFDPCCGSGTTLAAAAMSGRRAIGCDINPDAVRIAQDRLARAIARPVSESSSTPTG
jgi:DNA modification methylase